MRKLVVILWCLCLHVGCSSAPGADEARLSRICKILDVAGNYDLPQPEAPHRLIQEIARMAPRSPAARKALVKYAFSNDEISPVAADALARVPGVDVRDVIATFLAVCKDCDDAEVRENRLLICLQVFGQMGERAAGAAPFLLEELQRYADTPHLQGAILLVLANIGHDPSATTARLRAGIAEMGDAGESDAARVGEGAVGVLSRTGVGAWFDDAMLFDVLRRLKGTSFRKGRGEAQRACFLALALMRLGDRAKPAHPEITRLRAEAEAIARMGEEPGPPVHLIPFSRIVFGFCEWQMTPSDETPLRQTLKFLHDGAGLNGRPGMQEVAPLLNDQSVAVVVRLLSDEDPQIVESAIRVCGVLGLRASAARQTLLRILDTAVNETGGADRALLVDVVTQSLASVGSPKDIPQLRELLEKTSDDERRKIAGTIKALELLE